MLNFTACALFPYTADLYFIGTKVCLALAASRLAFSGIEGQHLAHTAKSKSAAVSQLLPRRGAPIVRRSQDVREADWHICNTLPFRRCTHKGVSSSSFLSGDSVDELDDEEELEDDEVHGGTSCLTVGGSFAAVAVDRGERIVSASEMM